MEEEVRMKLKDRVAIVTGGSAGIGKAIASEFLKEGAKVVICGRREEKVRETVAELSKTGPIAGISADVGLLADVRKLLDYSIKTFGDISIVVNNAAIIHQAKIVDLEEADWDRVIRNNLTSCFLCCREAARRLIAQKKGGRIINMSSIHAVLSEPQAGPYTAAKGGIEAFSRTLATELAPHGITVNCVEPGATYSELTVPMYTKAVKEALFKRIPMKEIAQPEWIARGLVFLASDDSRYMTGSVLTMDGGYTMDGSLPDASYWTE
jgi:NAD(P)-dependent dehydrogenase (short-subunit alcohol dehydrogenase family)